MEVSRHALIYTALVVFFIALTALVIRYDHSILNAALAMHSPFLSIFMFGLTEIVGIGVPVILLFLFAAKQREAFWDILIALVIDAFLIIVLKIWIARPRPYEIGFDYLITESFASFPSAHASRAFVIFGILAHAYKKYRWPFYCLAVLIAFSRVYLGVHYATDVLAGAMVGMLVSQIVWKLRLGRKAQKKFKRLYARIT